MISTTEQERKLQQAAADELKVNPETLDPEHKSVLRKIADTTGEAIGEGAHVVGAPLDEFIRGERSHIELEPSKNFYQRLKERIKGKLSFRKAA